MISLSSLGSWDMFILILLATLQKKIKLTESGKISMYKS